jgi:hypothetical protein
MRAPFGAAIVSAATALLVAGAAPVVIAQLGPGKDGEIRVVYWDLFKKTEVTLWLVPGWDADGPNPTTLSFSAEYPGRELKRAPLVMVLRAQTDLLTYPTRLRETRLEVEIDGERLELTAPDRQFTVNYPCGADDAPCAFDAVVATLSGVELLRMAYARTVTGNALGFPFALSQAQIEKIREFSKRIDPGR